jgi:hypothetical protein
MGAAATARTVGFLGALQVGLAGLHRDDVRKRDAEPVSETGPDVIRRPPRVLRTPREGLGTRPLEVEHRGPQHSTTRTAAQLGRPAQAGRRDPVDRLPAVAVDELRRADVPDPGPVPRLRPSGGRRPMIRGWGGPSPVRDRVRGLAAGPARVGVGDLTAPHDGPHHARRAVVGSSAETG